MKKLVGKIAMMIVTLGAVALATQQCTALGFPSDEGFSSFPLDQPGEYVFHFHVDLSRNMTLLLEVNGSKGESSRPELTHIRANIEVTLVNHKGRTICHASGLPKDGITSDSWALRRGHDEAAFWHRSCSEIKLKRSESYTLTVRIRDVDPKTPRIRLIPILERSDDFGP
jgi:hypothetical protein